MEGGSGAPAPFLTKTYEMVDDPATNLVVSWSQMNNSFVVWNMAEFARDLLPKYFKHNNFSSFVRQLNTYGFRKIDPDQWEFANEDFVRGQRHLLKKIHRRKPIHSHSLQNHGQGVLTESVRQELEEEIDRLKHEKTTFLVELQRETQETKGMELQTQSLQEHLQQMEHRQRQMMAGVAQVMQRPGYIPSLVQHSKKRRLPNGDFICEEAHTEQNQIVKYQAASDLLPALIINTEPFEKLESCIHSWENFLHVVGQASGEEYSVETASLHPYAAILTEMRASSGDTDISLRPQSPKLFSSSPQSKDTSSSPELAESTCCAESPVISSRQLNPPGRHKDLEIDVNLRPASAEIESSKDQNVRNAPSTTPTGVNDHFWEQFLTETPGSAETQEVQSERRDAAYKKGESKPVDRGRYWLHMRTVGMDNLTEQMGHLTPAERT